jgi:hypothetical protein
MFGVLASAMIPFIWMIWTDHPKRGDNSEGGGDISGGDYAGYHDGGHGGGDGGGH